jgi:hypothetical protein
VKLIRLALLALLLPQALFAATTFNTTVSTSLPCNVVDQVWTADATSAALTLTLPSAACSGARITIVKKDSSANAITIGTVSSQTILSTAGNSATSATLSAQGKAWTLVANGTFWITTASQ